ncbi:MAG: hypothetical protein AB1649_14130 [Chloroflexota bacterium]
MVLKGRLSGGQRMRLRALFDMLYKPSELAEDIGVTARQVYRVYLPLGCPFVKENGRILINGKAFAEWYEATYTSVTLAVDEAFCLTCKKAVRMLWAVRKISKGLRYIVSECPNCGRKLSRIVGNDKSRELATR